MPAHDRRNQVLHYLTRAALLDKQGAYNQAQNEMWVAVGWMQTPLNNKITVEFRSNPAWLSPRWVLRHSSSEVEITTPVFSELLDKLRMLVELTLPEMPQQEQEAYQPPQNGRPCNNPDCMIC